MFLTRRVDIIQFIIQLYFKVKCIFGLQRCEMPHLFWGFCVLPGSRPMLLVLTSDKHIELMDLCMTVLHTLMFEGREIQRGFGEKNLNRRAMGENCVGQSAISTPVSDETKANKDSLMLACMLHTELYVCVWTHGQNIYNI